LGIYLFLILSVLLPGLITKNSKRQLRLPDLKEFSISACSTVNRFAGWAVLYVMPMNRGRGNISLGGYRDETEAPV
jgi:hypothetical protein